MKKTFGGPTLLLVVTILSLALFLPALQSGIGGGGQSNVSGGGGVTFPTLAPTQSIGATTPNYSFVGQTSTGFYATADPFLVAAVGGTSVVRFSGTGGTQGIALPGGLTYGFSNTISVGIDTAMGRISANLFGFGNGTAADTSGSIRAASYQSVGTTFAASGCANSTLVGGATAGSYVSVTAGSCTVTVTMGSSSTAPHGWACDAHDITTVADANNVTLGSLVSTTQATLVEGTVAANDVIVFKCMGY